MPYLSGVVWTICNKPNCPHCLIKRITGHRYVGEVFPINSIDGNVGTVLCPYQLKDATDQDMTSLCRSFLDDRVSPETRTPPQPIAKSRRRKKTTSKPDGSRSSHTSTDSKQGTTDGKDGRTDEISTILQELNDTFTNAEYQQIKAISKSHYGGTRRCPDGNVIGKCSVCKQTTSRMYSDATVTLCNSDACWRPYFRDRPKYSRSPCSMCTYPH
jgi:hypothetical protein